MNKNSEVILLFVLVMVIVVQAIIIGDLRKNRTPEEEPMVVNEDSKINPKDKMNVVDSLGVVPQAGAEAEAARRQTEEAAQAYIDDLKGVTIVFQDLVEIENFLERNKKTLSGAIKEELSGRLALYQEIAQSAMKRQRRVEDMKSYVNDKYCSSAQKEALYALYDHVEHDGKVYNYADEEPESIQIRNRINNLFCDRAFNQMSDFRYIAKVANDLIEEDY